MEHRIQGWKHTLLFVLLFWLSASLGGCSGRAKVYTAGVREQETADTGAETGEAAERNGNGADTVADVANVGLNVEDAGSAIVDGETAKAMNAQPEDMTGTDAEPLSAESESRGYVYVCGAVNAPGVYPMREGMRVFEAVELAGGFAPEADSEWLNQAEPVKDGERLYVYTKEETRTIAESRQADGQEAAPVLWAENAGAIGNSEAGNGENRTGVDRDGVGMAGDSGADGAGADGQKVNLNTADREQLKTLPGIGDAKADAILQYREDHGGFGAIEEIQNISGIKSGVFSKIKDLITV